MCIPPLEIYYYLSSMALFVNNFVYYNGGKSNQNFIKAQKTPEPRLNFFLIVIKYQLYLCFFEHALANFFFSLLPKYVIHIHV